MRRCANALTLGRAFMGLPLVLALTSNYLALAWSLLLIAGLSDIADGKLARLAGGGSVWGARLDPLADKIIIAAPLLWIGCNQIVPIWTIWILITRDLVVSAWRSNHSLGGPASFQGKAKTTIQFLSILFLIWPIQIGGEVILQTLHKIGWIIYWPSLIISIYSAITYIKYQPKSCPN